MDCLPVALEKDRLITQLDISSAYVYIELETELYIMILPHIEQSGKIPQLDKSLYNLKQNCTNWYKKIKKKNLVFPM